MEPADYERCRRIWQRVSPELEPYPEPTEAGPPALPGPPESDGAARLRQLMEEALAERRACLAAACRAPHVAGQRLLRQLAAREGAHARRLAALYYLLSGERCCPVLPPEPAETLPWPELLRRRCRQALQAGQQYAALAGESPPGGPRQLLEELSADEYHHARCLLRLLEQNILAF